MTFRFPMPILVAMGSVALAAGLVTLISGCEGFTRCAYGSGRSPHSCKARPAPQPEELAAAIDGSALEAALTALARSTDIGSPLLGVGLNRWGEVSFAIPAGASKGGETQARFVRFGPRGAAVDVEGVQSGYVDVHGSTLFEASLLRPQVLRKVLGRIDRRERFVSARFEPAFLVRGLGWHLSFVNFGGEGNGEAATYYMGADGSGLCRINPGPPPSAVPDCDIRRLMGMGTQFQPADAASAAAPPRAPAADPELSRQFEQMSCVRNAQGDVRKLKACVQAP